jgi:hypothetical protein
MKNTKKLGIITVIAVIGLIMLNCENGTTPGGNEPTSIITGRYETVPYGSDAFGGNSEGDPSYVLVSSAKEHDNSAHYYLYYMGYIKNVPIAYKTPYRYDGITPITISYEKSWATEDAIMQSMTTAKEETWNVSASLTHTTEISVSGGIKPFGEVAAKASLATQIGGGYGETVSASSTYETTTTKMQGESESISATIGEHGEAPGVYRYALFGTTDVYCLFEVKPSDHTIQNVKITNSARANSLAWGIDFNPDGNRDFGKTGTGDKFEIPEIDFTQVEAPTESLDGPPTPPPPDPRKASVYKQSFETIPTGTIGRTLNAGSGDADIHSGGSKWIKYQVRANFSIGDTGRYIRVKLYVLAWEVDSNWTNITATRTFDVATENNELIHSLDRQTARTPNANDYIILFGNNGEYFDGNLSGEWKALSTDISTTDNETLFHTSIRVDGPGNDNDADGVDIKGDIRLYYTTID